VNDEFAYLRGAVNRAAAMQQELNDLVVPPTEGDGPGSGGVAATASPDLYTDDEYEAFCAAVWSLAEDEDLTRFDDLLHAALAFIGAIALDRRPGSVDRAVALLRAMEQRALWGPDHPVRQP